MTLNFNQLRVIKWLIPLLFVLIWPKYTVFSQESEPSATSTDLFEGDIAVIGYNSGPTAQISFVLLENIVKGTEIRFTDNGWSDELGLRQDEGSFTWTATQDMCSGTVVSLNFTTLDVAPGGDQILAYQRNLDGRLSFLYGLNSVTGNLGWQEDGSSLESSAIPTGLVEGESAISLGGPPYAEYTGPTAGTREDILAAIAVPTNWTTSDQQPLFLTEQPFIVTDAAPCKICNFSQERTYQFVGGLSAEVVSLGRFVTLRCIEVAFQTAAHPLADLDPRYDLDDAHWRLTTEPQNAIGFQAHITLEAQRPIGAEDRLCQLIATAPVQWECTVPSSFFENQMTLRNFSQFHDIAIGRPVDASVGIDPVPLAENPLALPFFLTASGVFMVGLLTLMLWLMSHYRQNDR